MKKKTKTKKETRSEMAVSDDFSKMASLLDVDEFTMVKILDQLELKSIMSLRRVCRGLRNFINDYPIKTDITEISIMLKEKLPYIGFGFRKYEKYGTPDSRTKDWSAILTLFREKLVKFHFEDMNLLKNVVGILKNRPHPLMIETFEVKIANNDELMDILTLLDPKALKEVIILKSDRNDQYSRALLDMDRISKTEQWKQLETFLPSQFYVEATPLFSFVHLKSFSVDFADEVPIEDFLKFKDIFTRSPHMQFCAIGARNLNQNILRTRFGKPFIKDNNDKGCWYFRLEYTDQKILKIHHLWSIYFWIVDIENVTKKAEIRYN